MTEYAAPTRAQYATLERMLGEEMVVDALLARDGAPAMARGTSIRSLYALAIGSRCPAATATDHLGCLAD